MDSQLQPTETSIPQEELDATLLSLESRGYIERLGTDPQGRIIWQITDAGRAWNEGTLRSDQSQSA